MSKKKGERTRRARTSSRTARSRSPAVLKKLQGHPWLFAVVLSALVVAATYSVSLSSTTFILHEKSNLRLPVLSHVRNVPHILSRDFLLFSSGQFRPLSYLLLSVLRTFVAPENAFFWHLWLLGFHVVNAVLVFAIARHFTQRMAAALMAAAVFALHPLGTVIVNDVNQFHILLGLTLFLGASKAYLSFSRSADRTSYWLAVFLFALALITARPALFLVLILLAYEVLYRRSPLGRTLLRMIPFVLLPVALVLLCHSCTPHPLHYKYVSLYKGLAWHGLFSVTGATGQYASGLLLTRGIPLVLHDIVEKIYRWGNPKFLFWGGLNLVLIVAAVLALIKKLWLALGILIIYIAMIPFASVAYNRVEDYVSWSYLYFPAAGLGLFAAGLYDLLLRARSRLQRDIFAAIFIAVVLFFTARSVQLNWYTRTPLAYWNHVAEMNQNSPTALVEVGRAYLATGQVPMALHYFFAPTLKDFKVPCLAMAQYYLAMARGCYERRELPRAKQYLLASAIHLRAGSTETKIGLILEDNSEVAGQLLLEAGALDHAEENFGKVLMVDPFNTTAMTGLAQAWFLKGFVAEAHRMLERARAIAPDDKNVALTRQTFAENEQQWGDNPQPFTIVPPDPNWLRYVLTQMRTPTLRQEIVALSDTVDPNDAVIQLEAVICLLIDERYDAAAKELVPSTGKTRADMVLHGLSGNAYACAVVSRALALAGDAQRAIQVGLRAITLDNTSTLAWEGIALAFSQQESPDVTSQEIMNAIAQHPASASKLFYNLGLDKAQAGKNQEAADLFERAVKAQPSNVEALQALGEVLVKLGQPDRAAETLTKAIQINPGEAKTHANLGWAFRDQGKHLEAAQALRTAVQLDPNSPLYHSDLGVALARLNKQEEAKQEYLRAIELDPNSVNAHYNLGNLLARAGSLPEAIREYRQVIKIRPEHAHAHFTLGSVLYRQKKIDEAIAEFQEGLRQDPKIADAYSALTTLYCEKGEYDKAWDTVQRAHDVGLEIDPDTLAALKKASPDGNE
jgi:tetratricopeptide (TPR) repeat protein